MGKILYVVSLRLAGANGVQPYLSIFIFKFNVLVVQNVVSEHMHVEAERKFTLKSALLVSFN